MVISQLPNQHVQNPADQKKKKRIIMISAFLAFIIVMTVIGFFIYRTISFTSKVFKSGGISDIISFLPGNPNAYSSDVDKSLKNGQTINVLLLGYGGAGHDGAYLTDSIMVASINPKLKNVALISIPRDMWVKIPISTTGGMYGKINSAYEIGLDNVNYQDRSDNYKGTYGGGNIAKDVVGNVLGQKIDYFVGIDFSAFSGIVDDLGGVDITVDHSFDDYEYPSGDNTTDGPLCSAPMNTKTICRYWHVHFDAGAQHMNGQMALEYARSRHALGSEGSDFARAQRQQKLMVAIKDKAMQVNALPKIFDIMNSLQNNVQTDFTVADIKDLASTVKSWDMNNIIHFAITDANYLTATYSTDGQYILIPRTGQGDYTQIQTAVQNVWSQAELANELKNAKVEVENATGGTYMFNQAVSDINGLGITTTTGIRQPITSTTTIYDFSNGKEPEIVKELSSQTGGAMGSILPSNPDNVTVLVVIGSNYQSK